jgi:hypothetical protein
MIGSDDLNYLNGLNGLNHFFGALYAYRKS